MPALYDKMGIRFQYPENWTVDESDTLEGEESVTVFSPGGAFWTVSVYPRFKDPEELVESALEGLRQEYPDLETEKVSEKILGYEAAGYDVNFFHLDFTITAIMRGLRIRGATLVIFSQAEDRELQKIGPVFQAMTHSLLKNQDEDAGLE